ncbi:MAG: indolepyruvate oxidoreductase subunit beta [Planctomycetes bacterium]|nr:indolepyruvate oxidoreductase subunit beta [Planctomycetota bacterium]
MTDGKTVNVLVVGIGGQGIILLSDILAEAAFESGHDVKKSEIHGLSQRGGSVISHVRWGTKVHSPVIMDGQADFILALEEIEALRNAHVAKPGGMILVNDFRSLPASVVSGAAKCPENIESRLAEYASVEKVPATSIARELGNIRTSNIVLLGALSRHLEIADAFWQAAVKKHVPKKYADLNLKAFARGRAAEQHPSCTVMI